jgi:integrase
VARGSGEVEEKKESSLSSIRTVLHADEIDELKQFHDNSLAASTRRAYQSDYDNLVGFLRERFPRLSIERLQSECTLEHVLAYLLELCREGKTVSTINRRLSVIRKHVLPSLFNRALVPGSRDEQTMQQVDAIVKGIRRSVGAERRVRGKAPLLVEDVRRMADVAAQATDDDGAAMPNKRSRDVALLLFLFHSAMRRNEVAKLLWSDLTFDKRGVVVLIRHSKTDAESKGQEIALPRLDGRHCPVAAMEAWRTVSGGVGESPVFRWISPRDEIQWRVLIDQRIVAIVKQYCEKVGLDSRNYAGHSTRSGWVTSSSARGVGIGALKIRTRHRDVSSLSVYMKSSELFNNAGDHKL